MSAILADTVAGLALTVVLLAALIVAIRARAIRRRRRTDPLRSSAERLVADFLVDQAALPTEAGPDERAALLVTSLEALADLRGSERARLGPPGLAALLRVARSGPPQVAELAEAAAQS